MGTDKALLIYRGKTLLARAAETVRDAVGSVTLVGDPGKYSQFDYPTISDLHASCGPLGGIQAALESSPCEWNLLVGCDMPGLHAALLRGLVEIAGSRGDADVVIAESDGLLQPLCAVYHQRVLPVVSEALASGQLKSTRAIAALRLVRVDPGDPEAFRNINTPDEWKTLVLK